MFWKSSAWERLKKVKPQTNPERKKILRPLAETPLSTVRVMFVGNRPEASFESDGFAFSYPKRVYQREQYPKPVRKMFDALVNDLGVKYPKTGSLKKWARQGVLLWNAHPVVEKERTFPILPGLWEILTKEIIETVYLVNPSTVFVFWGPIPFNLEPHKVLPKDAFVVSQPGPGSMMFDEQGFINSHPFRKIDEMFKESKQGKIKW